MDFFLDIETRSAVDITTGGASFYANHSSATILIASIGYIKEGTYCDHVYRFDRPSTHQKFKETLQFIADNRCLLWCHNVYFEYCFINRFYPDIANKINWMCTMGLATVHGLPKSLSDVASALGLPNKLSEGKELIQKYSCINKKTKEFYDQIDADFDDFVAYCQHDAYLCSQIIQFFDQKAVNYEANLRTFTLVCMTNERGIPLDTDWCDFAYRALMKTNELIKDHYRCYDEEKNRYVMRFNPNSVAQIKKLIKDLTGQAVTAINANNIEELIKMCSTWNTSPVEVSGHSFIVDVLRARKCLSLSSVKKYKQLRTLQDKGRIKGGFKALGAYTGRDAGQLFQPQNFPSCSPINKEAYRKKTTAILSQEDADFDALYYVVDQAKQGLRQAFTSKKWVFFCGDYSKIEYCVIRWFLEGKYKKEPYDIYKQFMADMYGKPIDTITKEERSIGKTSILSMMYGTGFKAIHTRLTAQKIEVSIEACEEMVYRFRHILYPKISHMWGFIQEAAIQTINEKVVRATFNKLNATLSYIKTPNPDINFLAIYLPSGRPLCFLNPMIVEGKFGNPAIQVERYIGSKLTLQSVWGGNILQNIVQALARDILAYHCFEADKAGLDVVMRVHDELVVESEDKSDEAYDTFKRVLSKTPPWLTEFDLNIETWRGNEYHK